MTRTPVLLVGDGPQEPTGLGRIARDLAALVVESDLLIDLVQVGGPIPPVWTRWRHVPMGEAERGDDWGASYVTAIWRSLWGDQPGVCWLLWDPGRVAAYVGLQVPVQLWTYTAIDAPNRLGTISGPAAEALQVADRVIAYGRWASRVIQPIRSPAPVPYLPHGLTLATYQEPATIEEQLWVGTQLGPHVKRHSLIIGCVATNQPRKDLGLYFQTLAELKARGHTIYGWLHTDVLTKAWAVAQLVEDCGLQKQITVSTVTYTDRQLACLYQACDCTIAPGLGEGFGYPIVESLASGVPVIHGDFGGGAELVPKTEWRVPVREVRLEGIYAQQRPVFRPTDVANAVERALAWRTQIGPDTASAYCRGTVAHLDWSVLWPRWRSWIHTGLNQ
jgi:glycosyltransferase involved in cell wall biosynthesis